MVTIEETWAMLEERCGQRMKLDKDAARALALAAHEADCLDCRMRYQDSNETAWQECPTRARIQALGK